MDHWVYLLGFLRVALCLHNSSYVVHEEKLSFEEALKTCQQDGFLTDMADKNEAEKIVSATSEKIRSSGTFQFWVGLRKSKLDCVFENPPLMGFKWTVNNSTDSEVNRWLEIPAKTCTSVRCGLLTVEYNGNTVTNWGWKGSSCRQTHPFICKRIRSDTSECLLPQIFEVRELIPVAHNHRQLKVHCSSNETFTLTCSPTKEWKVGNRATDVTSLCLACNLGYKKDDEGNCVDIDECKNNPCMVSCQNTEGSYRCDYDATQGYLQSENIPSVIKLPVTPASSTQVLPTGTLSPKPTNGKGFPPTSIPENPTTTIIPTHVNLETSGGLTSVFIPALVAVAALVVVVVIILLIVKCCFRKRTKKISREAGGKSKETVALKDSADSENQKEAV